MSDSDEPSAEVKKEVDEKATGDNPENASAGNKTTQGGRKSRAKFPPPRSMSKDEYAEIFDAVLARMEAEQLAEADAEAAAAKQLDLNIKEDDFDAILQETDKVIGNYVDAFLGDDEEEVEKFNKEDVVTSTPVLEQILHSSQEEAEKKTKKKEKKEKERKEVIQPKEKERKEVIQPKEKERKEVIQPKKVKKHPSSEVKETASKEQEKISKRELMQKREIATAGTWVQCEACGKWRYLAEMVDPALLPQRWTCADNTDEMHNCCNDAEEDWSEDEHTDDYVFNKFTEGSIVWARMSGFPWWPAMVEVDPDEDCYFECNVNMDRAHGMTNVATHYHVVFFDDKVSRAWVCSSNVHVFTGMEDMGSCKVRGVNYKKQIEKAVQNAMSCLELSLEERIKKCGFAVRYNGRWGSTKEKKEKKKTKKRKKKSGSDHDTETSILEKVEKLLESTENVLDGMLSQSESDSEHDTSVPVKKRKVQADKKPKKKENKEPVKKPTFAPMKKAPKATSKKQESADESDDGEQVKKKPSEDKPPTAKKPAKDKPAPKEKAQKKVKSEDEISGSPKKKIDKEEEEESEPQKKKPKKEKSDVKKETTKSDTSKPTPQKEQKSAKTPRKENKSDKDKKEKVLKPVFGAPKVKKTVAKAPKKENDTKESNVEKPMEEENEEKKGNDEKSSTETNKESPKKSPQKEKPKPKPSEKIKPVIPKPKKAFMAPIVKKSDTKDSDEKKATKEKPKMVKEKANKEKESKSEQKDKATDKEKESKSGDDGKSEQKNKAAGKKQKEAKVKDEVTDEQDNKEDREQKDEITDEVDNKSAKEKDEDTASKELDGSANESSAHDKDSTSECENSFAQSPDPNESLKLSLKPEEFVETTKKVDEMDAPVVQAVQEDSDFDFEE